MEDTVRSIKASYKGYDIEVSKEGCLGGWEQTYFSIYRQSDGFECECSFSDDEDTLEDWVGFMKERIDAELAEDDPWEEKAKYGEWEA